MGAALTKFMVHSGHFKDTRRWCLEPGAAWRGLLRGGEGADGIWILYKELMGEICRIKKP